jgi:hypothetical protein
MSELQIVGKVSNPDWINQYGMFQKIYKQEDGINAADVAQNMLKGLEQKGTIQALGDVTCITGYSVAIKDDYTGMWGIFQIDSDTHTWENNIHKMTLELNFSEIMDEKKYRVKKASKSSSNTILEWFI